MILWTLAAFGAVPVLTGANVCGFGSSALGPAFEVRIPGTDRPLGMIGSWGGDPRMEAALGVERGRPVLRISAAGGGLTLVADVDITAQEPLALVREAEQGPMWLAADTHIVVTGFDGQRVRVTPRWDGLMVVPDQDLTLTVDCADLHVGWYLETDHEARIHTAAGLDGKETMWLAKGAPLRLSPDGPIFGHLDKDWGPVQVVVLDRKDGFTQIALLEWRGVLWRGWTEDRRLRTVDPATGGGGLGALGGILGGGAPPVRRACTSPLPLMHTSKKATLTVGMVAPGTPFEVDGPGFGGVVKVRFPSLWITAAEGTSLALPAGAADCPALPVEAAPGSLFDGLTTDPG